MPAHEPPLEICAGAVLVRRTADGPELLLIRRRARVHELPKGHIEPGETPVQAAARELCEETGLPRAPAAGPLLGTTEHRFDGTPPVHKCVHWFIFSAEAEDLAFGDLPQGTRALRWVRRDELAAVPLHSQNVYPVLMAAFAQSDG